MTVKELADKCVERNIHCNECPYRDRECESYLSIVEDMSPAGLLTIWDEELH